MDKTHITVLALAVGVTTLLAPLARRNYARDVVLSMRKKGQRAEDLRPQARHWYRLRAGALTFCATIMIYPIVRWVFPDERFLRIESLTDLAVFGAIALICSALAGHEIGGDWHGYAEAAYSAAKEAEDSRPPRSKD